MITAELRRGPSGSRIARIEPPNANLGEILPEFDRDEFPLLRLVDPFGDTYFSSYQSSSVANELRRLFAELDDERFQKLITLAEQCAAQPHTFLVFLGD